MPVPPIGIGGDPEQAEIAHLLPHRRPEFVGTGRLSAGDRRQFAGGEAGAPSRGASTSSPSPEIHRLVEASASPPSNPRQIARHLQPDRGDCTMQVGRPGLALGQLARHAIETRVSGQRLLLAEPQKWGEGGAAISMRHREWPPLVCGQVQAQGAIDTPYECRGDGVTLP